MRKGLLSLACVAACVAFGEDHADYARLGSITMDTPIATNVYPCSSAYFLHNVDDGMLVDRAVNAVSVPIGGATFTLPLAPHTTGFARAFLVYANSVTDSLIHFNGATQLYTTTGETNILVSTGLNVLSFIELTNRVYLVEARPLTAAH